MNITRSDGKNIPFAADIYDEQGNVIGNVGQGGQAFVRGIEQQGNISIKWLEQSKPYLYHISRKNSTIYYSEWNSVLRFSNYKGRQMIKTTPHKIVILMGILLSP